MKRYRIVNKARFVCFALAVCLTVCFVISGVFKKSLANEEKDYRYTEVTVEEGDTLWELAKIYGSGEKDLREVIYDICTLNGIKAGDIQPGQTLLIPQE